MCIEDDLLYLRQLDHRLLELLTELRVGLWATGTGHTNDVGHPFDGTSRDLIGTCFGLAGPCFQLLHGRSHGSQPISLSNQRGQEAVGKVSLHMFASSVGVYIHIYCYTYIHIFVCLLCTYVCIYIYMYILCLVSEVLSRTCRS